MRAFLCPLFLAVKQTAPRPAAYPPKLRERAPWAVGADLRAVGRWPGAAVRWPWAGLHGPLVAPSGMRTYAPGQIAINPGAAGASPGRQPRAPRAPGTGSGSPGDRVISGRRAAIASDQRPRPRRGPAVARAMFLTNNLVEKRTVVNGHCFLLNSHTLMFHVEQFFSQGPL